MSDTPYTVMNNRRGHGRPSFPGQNKRFSVNRHSQMMGLVSLRNSPSSPQSIVTAISGRKSPRLCHSAKPRGRSADSLFLDDIDDIDIDEIDQYFDDPDILGQYSCRGIELPALKREVTSNSLYEVSCKKLGVNKLRFLERQLSSGSVRARHRGLGPAQVKSLAIALTINSCVSMIDLRGNELGPAGADHFAQVLSDSPFLIELDLSENYLGCEGAKSLCEALVSNRWLRKLGLSGNAFTEKSAKYFAKLLRWNTGLNELDLSHNQFGSDGGVLLASGIAVNGALDTLDLSWNHIRLKGAEAVCLALKRNKSIEHLDLKYNGLSDAGCRALSVSLPHNTTLLELDISCNRISATSFWQMLSGLKKNTNLHTLKVGDNPLTTQCVTEILRMIVSNPRIGIRELDLTHITVNAEFLNLLQIIRQTRYIRVTHDVSFGRDESVRNEGRLNVDDPMLLIINYLEQHNLRMVDLFRNFDDNKNNSLSKEEFLSGLKATHIDITQDALDRLVKRLDQNGDGEIDFSEMIYGHKLARRKLKKQKEAARRRENELAAAQTDGLTTVDVPELAHDGYAIYC